MLRAEPVADQFLAEVKVQERNECAIVKIAFHSRVQYLSHFPLAQGDELRILLNPVDRGAAKRTLVANRESLRAPVNERASIHAIEFEVDSVETALTLYFRRNVAWKVAPGKDAQSIVVAVPGKSPSSACEPKFDDNDKEAIAAALRGSQAGRGDPVSAALAALSRLEPEQIDAQMADARAAMGKGDYDKAVGHLTRVVEAGATKAQAEALELLGLAREKKGQIAHARAEYQSYLKLFPKHEGAARVRQRLAAMDAKDKEAFDKLARSKAAEAERASGGATAKPDYWKGDKKILVTPAPQDVAAGGAGPDLRGPQDWTIRQAGSVSGYYNLNQGGRSIFTAPKQQDGWEKENIYQTYQNSLLGNYDADVAFEKPGFIGRFRFAGSQEHRFIGDNTEDTRISSLYFDAKARDSGLSARVGRQSRYTGGVLGRFDGGLLGYQWSEAMRVNGVVGAPVERSDDRPFLHDRYFYGIGTEYALAKGLDVGAYVIEQRAETFVDRRAVGGDARYIDDTMSSFASLDFDTHYADVNNALFSGTRIFADKSTASLSLDYRRSPMIFATNAMQGQTALTLRDLLRRYTGNEIETMAHDRTARSYTGSAGYSRPITEHLQLNAELTMTNMSSTETSGGVEASPSTGWDLFTLAQVIGTDITREGDVFIAGVRFADTQSSLRYLLEASARYPITKDWRVNPMILLGYVDYKTEPRLEYHVQPTLRTTYNMTRDLSLELEIGKKWIMRDTVRGREDETELLLLTGARYDFYGPN